MNAPAEQLGHSPSILRITQEIEIAAHDLSSIEHASDAGFKLLKPDGHRLPAYENDAWITHNLLNTRENVMNLAEIQRRN